MLKRIASRAWLAMAVLVAVALVAWAAAEQNVAKPRPSYPRPDFTEATAYPVVDVIDGDTVALWIDGQRIRVRLVGVDTPETVHPQKPVEAYGREASRFTANMLRGEAVYLQYSEGQGNKDQYGRTLAFLFRVPDGLFVNLEIVRQGYGHAETRWPHQYLDLFRYYEQDARETQRGLWNPEAGTVAPTVPSPTPAPLPQQSLTPDQRPDEQPVIVYVTRTGAKYHRAGCRYLSRSQIPMRLEEAKRRYGPCSVCAPPP